VRLVAHFDEWVARAPVSHRDLSIGRIIYATIGLLTIWRADFAAALPAAAYRPPWGPFRLISGPPPAWAISLLTLALAGCLAFLLIGFFTRTASLATAALLVTLFGFGYSFYQIDHTIMLAVVPLVMAWSSWGSHFSIDSARSRDRPGQPWTPRVLALALGICYASAGWAKLRTGWLDPHIHTSLEYFLGRTPTTTDAIKAVMLAHPSPLFWEAVDVGTVVLELGVIVSVLWWPAFRILIACATVFHLGILLILSIHFFYNIPAYAMFVPWYTLWPLRYREWRLRPRAIVAVVAGAAIVAIVAWKVSSLPHAPVYETAGRLVIITAAAAGSAFLVSTFGSAASRLWRGRPRPRAGSRETLEASP